ncbi:hypothetical protein MML48_9g00014674 [Holotrichia oblita]|uniref:Uncharacterized protein n=1 Tax=Holotrichia oblita TaxID=644536 RepID=A0ACB9SM81_HOLOL|nr:hypothetical protein MML48_9g00014674 [Holotrichia oblita]
MIVTSFGTKPTVLVLNFFANLPDDIFLNDEKTNQCSPVPSTSENINPVRKHSQSKATTSNMCQKKVAVKRKFPGPAGLFPEMNEMLDIDTKEWDQNPFVLSSQFLSSQTSNLTFQEITWQDMCKDFKHSNLLKKYDIKWISDNISLNLVNKKVPFLAGIIKTVKNTSKSPIFVLADRTGEVEALISSDLYEDYNEYLVSDSVLILKQFSILSVSSNKHYVNITTDNLIRIYSCKESEDYVNVVHIQEISNSDLEKDIIDFVNKYERLQDNFKRGPVMNQKVNLNGFSNLEILNNACHDYIKPISSNKVENNFNNNVIGTNKPKKFNFKNVLNEINVQKKNMPSTSLNTAKNIFENSNSSSDIFDLNLDDFQDDFSVPEVNQENFPKSNETKKRRRESLNDSLNNTKNVYKNGTRTGTIDFNGRQSNKIDCSQISIISQNTTESSDIIKEVFSDLDASALFDDF